jgi:spermidine synthase
MVECSGTDKRKAQLSFLAVTACGFVSSIGQIVILRELLVLFYGNELSTGLIFASWLLWTALGSSVAGCYGERLSRSTILLPTVLALLALLLPVSVLWIRAARIIWAIPLGEMLDPFSMLWISLSGTGFFCLFSGVFFGLAWSSLEAPSERGSSQPLFIYLGEALGAATGGLFFYFILLPSTSILNATLFTALIALMVAAILFRLRSCLSSVWHAVPSAALLGVLVVVTAVLAYSGGLDRQTRRWQWGANLLAVRDTPFQNLALLADTNQFTLFANGLLSFSTPDPQTAEYAVHLALLQHGAPGTVLVIGAGVGGLLPEVLKHQGITRLDYVEPDPEVIELAEEFLPDSATATLLDKRVHLFHSDASTFIRSAKSSFDVVIMHLGDPVNAEMNRFYTMEFFGRISRLLKPDGIFSFAITSSPDMVGPAEARLLQSVFTTLHSVFPAVLVIPGEYARFLASHGPENLTADPQEMIRRIAERRLDLRYVREYYLFDYLNPMRLDYLQAILGQSRSVPINKDFEPTCYFNNLLVWAAQSHPDLGEALYAISKVGRPLFWTLLGMIIFGLLCLSRSNYGTTRNAILLNMLIVGGIQMVLEIVLLLGFQILEGFVYTQLALIISFFMAGLALGPGVVAMLSSRITNPCRWLFFTQSVLAVYLLGTLWFFFLLQHQLQNSPQGPLPVGVVFSLIALLGGILSGLHFSFSVQSVSSLPGSSGFEGPKLYALDLLGATAGVLAASLFVLPAYGLTTTMLALAVLCLAGALTLIRSGVKGE